MSRIKTIIGGFIAIFVLHSSFALSLSQEEQITVTAGKTVEIPLVSDTPMAGDLTAFGKFSPGDVIFTPGPGCHLSLHGCTLLITASANSRDYINMPVIVSEASNGKKQVFRLTVTHQLTTTNIRHQPIILRSDQNLASQVHKPVMATNSIKQETMQHLQLPLQRSGNDLFYGVVEEHPLLQDTLKDPDNDFILMTNGPSYQIVKLTNNDVSQPLSIAITGAGASDFSVDNDPNDYGDKQNCVNLANIVSGDSCLLIVKGKVGDPNKPPVHANLTISGNSNNVASFDLTATTYVYAGGGFNTLGNASVSGGDLLAECTSGACSNALQGSTGDNYASTGSGVGNWINTMIVTSSGTLIVGGVFGAIGGAVSGNTSGTAALLAQCTPGSMVGNSCINQVNQTGSLTNANAFNSAYINAVTAPFAISASTFIAVAGDFSNMRSFSAASSGKMLAKCVYSGTSPNQTCSNYMTTGGSSSTKYANHAIAALNTLGSSSSSPLVNAGGLFTQIAGYPTSAPTSGTTFASCTSLSAGSCRNGMADNPDNSILGMADDGTHLYIGGIFTQAGGYSDVSGGYPLLSCTPSTTTTCSNALAGTNDANGYIEGLAYSGSSLYVGGHFTSIGQAAAVSAGNMLAACTPSGVCSNLVTDMNPYAIGGDWSGAIFAIAVGEQTAIKAK